MEFYHLQYSISDSQSLGQEHSVQRAGISKDIEEGTGNKQKDNQ